MTAWEGKHGEAWLVQLPLAQTEPQARLVITPHFLCKIIENDL
jgi:hypothetical protein